MFTNIDFVGLCLHVWKYYNIVFVCGMYNDLMIVIYIKILFEEQEVNTCIWHKKETPFQQF